MKYRKKQVIIEAYQTKKRIVCHTHNGDVYAEPGDYVITQIDGEKYPCKPEIFEKTYEEEKGNGMTIGQAIEAIKQGRRCARKCWNGKGQYIELAKNVSYISPNGEIANVNHEAMGNKAVAFVGTSGVQLGWLASQADLLSEDWYIVE